MSRWSFETSMPTKGAGIGAGAVFMGFGGCSPAVRPCRKRTPPRALSAPRRVQATVRTPGEVTSAAAPALPRSCSGGGDPGPIGLERSGARDEPRPQLTRGEEAHAECGAGLANRLVESL